MWRGIGVVLVAGLLLVPSVGAAPTTIRGDNVTLQMSFGLGLGTIAPGAEPVEGTLMVTFPTGQGVATAEDGWVCHSVHGTCESRVDVPPGTEASGTWVVTFQPHKPRVPLYSTCFPLPIIGACLAPFPTLGSAVVEHKLDLDLAGWSSSETSSCPALVPVVWVVDHDARTVAASCPLPTLPS